MKPSSTTLLRPWTLLPLAAALALSLSACGGGGGGGVASNTATPTAGKSTLSGAVIDGPIVGASIVITTGAPLSQPGATQVGTATSGAGGAYTVSVTLPNTTVPVFANATATTPSGTAVVLTAYLGSASTVSASGALTAANIPNLIISQVTTAALAVYQKLSGGSYANLTPAVYAALLSQHHDDILPIAAAIQAVTDDLCSKPTSFHDTESMAEGIANNSILAGGTSTSTVTTTASTTLQTGSAAGCDAELQNLTQSIASNGNWAPELDQGDINQSGITVLTAGNYTLQGLITQTGLLASAPASAPSTLVVAPSPFNDTTVTVSASGQISSTDNNVTGSVVGNYVLLNVTDASKNSYTFAGKLGVLPASFLSTGAGSGFAMRAGGQANGSQPTLTRFDAVLVPAAAQPNWIGVASNAANREDGLACLNGFGVRLMGNGSTVGGIVLGVCVSPQATGLALSQSSAQGMGGEDEYHMTSTQALSFSPFNLAQGMGASSMPFVISGAATLPGSKVANVSGTAYYVMGANEMVFSSNSPSSNGLFTMNENPLDKLQETQSNMDH
jgi:hypothetical protein